MNNFIGVDIGSKKLDVARNDGRCFVLENSINAIQNYFKSLCISDVIVVYESTGIYGRNLEFVCNKLWIRHFYLHPNVISNLKKALWDQNKTDVIDAKYIASMCPVFFQTSTNSWLKNKCIQWNSDKINSINAIMTEIRRMKTFNIKLKQALHCLSSNPYSDMTLQTLYQQQIDLYSQNIDLLYSKVSALIRDLWCESKYKNLLTIPWISSISAIELMILFINLEQKWFTKQDSKKVAKYVGINPKVSQSWTSLNKTWIDKQGNNIVRKSLYMPWTCRKMLSQKEKYKDTNLTNFYKRMESHFKPNPKMKRWKSDIMAMGKKLLTVAWAMYCDNTSYKFI